MTSFLAGFAIGLSLIVAIGAQNVFVLRQGIRKSHVGKVILTCILSDAVLILAGVAGFGALTRAFPAFEPIARFGGAAFLFAYGALSIRRALVETEKMEAKGAAEQSTYAAVMTCLALTWLNPHVYLDTVVLLGAVASQYGPERWTFGAGAVTASAAFFIALGYGATMLQPYFAKPLSWRILDLGVGILLWSIAYLIVFA